MFYVLQEGHVFSLIEVSLHFFRHKGIEDSRWVAALRCLHWVLSGLLFAKGWLACAVLAKFNVIVGHVKTESSTPQEADNKLLG